MTTRDQTSRPPAPYLGARAAQRDAPNLTMKEDNHDDEQTRFFRRPRDRCRSFADLHTWHGRKFNSSEGEQRRACAWAVRRRLVLVRSDRAIAGGGAQRHGRAKSADDAA